MDHICRCVASVARIRLRKRCPFYPPKLSLPVTTWPQGPASPRLPPREKGTLSETAKGNRSPGASSCGPFRWLGISVGHAAPRRTGSWVLGASTWYIGSTTLPSVHTTRNTPHDARPALSIPPRQRRPFSVATAKANTDILHCSTGHTASDASPAARSRCAGCPHRVRGGPPGGAETRRAPTQRARTREIHPVRVHLRLGGERR